MAPPVFKTGCPAWRGTEGSTPSLLRQRVSFEELPTISGSRSRLGRGLAAPSSQSSCLIVGQAALPLTIRSLRARHPLPLGSPLRVGADMPMAMKRLRRSVAAHGHDDPLAPASIDSLAYQRVAMAGGTDR